MKIILLLLLFCSFNTIAQDCDSLFQEVKLDYDNGKLDIDKLENVIKNCGDVDTYPELYYYRGMNALDTENYPLGIYELKRVQKYATDYKFQYKIAHNLGILYMLQGKLELGKDSFQDSYDIAREFNDTSYMDHSMESLLAAELESGNSNYLSIYEEYFLSKDFKDDYCTQLHTLTFIAEYYLVYEEYGKANKIITDNYKGNVTYPDCPTDVMSVYTIRSRIAQRNNEFEKSLVLLDSIPLENITLMDRVSIYKCYKATYQNIENQEQADVYADSITYVLESKQQENSELNLGLLDEIESREQNFNNKISKQNIYIILFIVALLLSAIALWYYRKTRTDLEEKNDFYKENYNNLWGSYQLSNKKLEVLKKELVAQKALNNSGQFNSLINDINIHLDSSSENPHKHVNMVQSAIVRDLKKKAPYLNDKEINICFFLKLNLSPKKIAEILSKSEKSIESYKYRINKKVIENSKMDLKALLQDVD